MAKVSKKKKFRNRMIVLSVVAIVTYTVAAIVLQFCTSVELSSTLTLCWYGFWTSEIFILAGITSTKIKNKYYEQAGMPESEEEV